MLTCKLLYRTFRPNSNLIKSFSSQEAPKSNKYPRRIFSGIQPTGAVHLGNYFGAIAQWVKLQNQGEDMLLSIVDLHSITLSQDPKILSSNILEMAATLLACGVDPEKVILFQQSTVLSHTYLCWCLGCISTMPRLAHLSTFKEKSANLKDVPLGLYIYPVLQAADILVYKATHVPVGEDQVQHIELTQDLARMFNKRHGETFPIPKALITGSEYARLKSLRDPCKKMSKSDPDPKAAIFLSDKPEDIAKKLKKSVTDFTSQVSYDPDKRPGVSNLISIHSFVSGKSVQEICDEVKDLNTGTYKAVVADAVVSHLRPIQKEMTHLRNDTGYLLRILKAGSEKASELSQSTVDEVRYKLGFQIDKRTVVEKLKADV